MRFRRFRFFDDIANHSVVAVRKLVTALIAVKGGGNGPDGHALSDTAFKVSLFLREDFDVLGAEMVVAVRCVLHDG